MTASLLKSPGHFSVFLLFIIMITIIILLFSEFFTAALADGFPLESEW